MANERQLSTLKKGSEIPLGSSEPLGRSRKIVSDKVGISEITFERAKKVIELASPELKEKHCKV